MYSLLCKISIQYSVSLASFNAIFNLCLKSSELSPNSDSLILAPILVPDFKICVKIGCSALLVCLIKYFDNLVILIPNARLLFYNALSVFIPPQLLIVHY